MKKILYSLIAVLLILPFTVVLSACANNDDNNTNNDDHLISVKMSTSNLVETKKDYHRGDSFSPSQTYVDLTYYDKAENYEWTLKNFDLTSLDSRISDIQYEVKGFDSSNVVNNQTISLTFSSEKYSGEISTSFTISILPEYVVSSEVVDKAFLKDEFALNEQLSYGNLRLQNTYSNGRTEFVNVTSDMVEGFDTSEISTSKKTMTITQNNFTITHKYVVTPSANFTLFDENFATCFVPSTSSGFTATQPEVNIYKYYKSSVASLQLGYYSTFSYTQSAIINMYNTGTIYNPTVTILSYETQKINGLDVTICKFKMKNSSYVKTAIYYDAKLTFSTGTSLITSNYTMEILFTDYANNAESAEILNILLTTLSK